MARFVLVPGAWLGAWAWEKVVPLLERQGHVTYPVTLTGMGERAHLANEDVGIESGIQDVLSVIRLKDLDDVVLVGHSFAGKVVAAAADRVPDKVSSIIYVDALRPDKVRTPQGGFDATKEFGPVPHGARGIPLTEKTVNLIGSDVVGEDLEWMMAKATPWPIRYSTDPITLSKNFDSLSCSYIFCAKSGDPVDEIIAGKWGRLDGPYKVIDSGHWPMITKPAELADDLISLSGSH